MALPAISQAENVITKIGPDVDMFEDISNKNIGFIHFSMENSIIWEIGVRVATW